MHFEILIEDQSGGKAMEILIPKLLGDQTTFKIRSYKGIGHIPKGLKPGSDVKKRKLLSDLPRVLQGHGKVSNSGTILVICDLDNGNKEQFLSELQHVLDACNPKPKAFFFLAVEEFEAWYLGDINAIHKAYPHAKTSVLNRYTNDSICGTWELLADAVYKGGHKALLKRGGQAVGEQKAVWATTISPYMNVADNKSPSFNDMYTKLQTINQ